MTLPIGVNIYERGAGGALGTIHLADLRERIQSYQHTIASRFGFESMSCSFTANTEEALDWLLNGLGRGVVAYGPDAETVWEGRLVQIDATFGSHQRSMSLDAMANRITVRYTTVLGTPGATSSASDTDSQGLYGVKDGVVSLNASTAADAALVRATELARQKNPRMTASSGQGSGEGGEVQVTLHGEGWYGALGWLLTSNTSTTNTATTTQLTTLLTAYNSTNSFFSTSSVFITASGQNATEFIPADTPYRQKIEDLLALGDGTNPYSWGVYEDRLFYAAPWTAASPTTIDYQFILGDSTLRDSSGGEVYPWSARPNKMLHSSSLIDTAPVATAQDAAARFFVARVSFSIGSGGYQLTLEPDDSDGVDVRLAALT